MPTAIVDILTENFGEWSSGFWVTVRLVAVSFVLAMVVGTAVAALRVAPNVWLQRLGGIYVEALRNTPLLVILILVFLGGRDAGLGIDAWTAGTLGLGLYTAAYIAEALRSGVFSVSQGQIEAALSLGLTYAQTMRRIILPQAFRTVISPLGSLIIAMIKNSAIIGASVLALTDLLKVGRVVQARNFQTLETFIWVAVGYLILTAIATLAIRVLERRYAIKR